MSYLKRLFGRKSNSSPKPSKGDSPTNSIIKKVLFYGFLIYTTTSIVSTKYKTSLIFTFEPNEQNAKIVDTIPVFHQAVYNPVYYMFFGPMHRIYTKYFQQPPYFRAIIQQANKQKFQIIELPVHDRYSEKKEKISLAILIAGSQGVDIGMKKLMLSMNANGFKTFCINPDNIHNIERLHKTIQYIKSKNPQPKNFGVGIQYGANLLVNYTAQNQKSFDSIVSVGNPLDLQKSQNNLERSSFIWKKILYEDILKGRIKGCQNYKNIMGEKVNLNNQNLNLYELDRYCQSKTEDYQLLKQKLSSINSIKKLKVPSFFIQSQQDPFSMPFEQAEQKIQNQKCIFVQTQRGGHIEWLQSMKKTRWIFKPIYQYLKYFDGRLGYIS